jgi:hypothetical protein
MIRSRVGGDGISLKYRSAKWHASINLTTPKGVYVNNKMIPLSRNRTYVHLSCTWCFVDVCNHHLVLLLHILQDSISNTCNISNVCVPKVKQFARASKLKFLIDTPHSRSLQILLATIVQLLLPLLLLYTTCALRRTWLSSREHLIKLSICDRNISSGLLLQLSWALY